MLNIKETLKFAIISWSNLHKQGYKRNIYMFSTPRSGSTWLMEIIASQPGFKYFDEPFNIRRENVMRGGFFHDLEFSLPGYNKMLDVINYLKELENNKLKFMNPPPFRRNHKFFTNRIIFKIHELEHMINIIKDTFDAQIVYLLRHPIATTLSRYVYPRLKYFKDSDYFKEHYLTKEQIEKSQEIYANGSDFEKGILSWCYQNLLPIRFLDQKDWIIITYEELLLNSYAICKMLYEKLDLESMDKIVEAICRPAVNIGLSTEESFNIMKGFDEMARKKILVTKWEKKVNETGQKIAFDILSMFDIDAYSVGRFIANDKYLNFKDTNAAIS